MSEVENMERYELFNEMIQLRVFIKNMDNDLLIRSFNVLKVERNRRIKIKINQFFNFEIFKNIY